MNIFIRKNDDDLLKYLSKDEVSEIRTFTRIIDLEKGEIAFSPGEKGRDIFLVVEGILEVVDKSRNTEEIVINSIYEGEIFGEANFAISIKRHFTVRAKEKAKLICYPYKQLAEIMKKNPLISASIYAAINDSLADKNIRITQRL